MSLFFRSLVRSSPTGELYSVYGSDLGFLYTNEGELDGSRDAEGWKVVNPFVEEVYANAPCHVDWCLENEIEYQNTITGYKEAYPTGRTFITVDWSPGPDNIEQAFDEVRQLLSHYDVTDISTSVGKVKYTCFKPW